MMTAILMRWLQYTLNKIKETRKKDGLLDAYQGFSL
jgi:hypothetical protein